MAFFFQTRHTHPDLLPINQAHTETVQDYNKQLDPTPSPCLTRRQAPQPPAGLSHPGMPTIIHLRNSPVYLSQTLLGPTRDCLQVTVGVRGVELHQEDRIVVRRVGRGLIPTTAHRPEYQGAQGCRVMTRCPLPYPTLPPTTAP